MEKLALKLDACRKQAGSLPLHQVLCVSLREQILAQQLLPGQCLPGVYELARQVGVNYRTVKTALDSLVAEGLIERGRGKLVVRPPQAASTGIATLAFFRWVRDPFSVALSAGMRQYAHEQGLRCTVVDAAAHDNRLAELVARADGVSSAVLVLPGREQDLAPAVRQARDRGVRIVALDRDIEGAEASCVCDDHYGGAYEAASHMLDLQDQPVYFFGARSDFSVHRLRLAGWQAAMREHDHGHTEPYAIAWPDVDYALVSRHDHEALFCRLARSFLKNRRPPLSVLAMNDYLALALCRAAAEREWRVGADVLVTGFGDLPFGRKATPSLTTVRQHPREVGYLAAQMLHQAAPDSGVHYTVPVSLVVRASTVGPKTDVAQVAADDWTLAGGSRRRGLSVG